MSTDDNPTNLSNEDLASQTNLLITKHTVTSGIHADISAKISTYMRVIRDRVENPSELLSISQNLIEFGVLKNVIIALHLLEKQCRMDLAPIFQKLLPIHVGPRAPWVEYITQHKICADLFNGYKYPHAALDYGSLIRAVLQTKYLTSVVLNHPVFADIWGYIEHSNEHISEDALKTLNDILVNDPHASSRYVEENYNKFFFHLDGVLNSQKENVKLKALKILVSLFLKSTSPYTTVIEKYMSSDQHFDLMLKLLLDHNAEIQLEAFHMFKIFMANPNKNAYMHSTLLKEKEKLIKLVSGMCPNSTDEQFLDEKSFILTALGDNTSRTQSYDDFPFRH